MSLHSGFPAAPGFPRVAADVNTFFSEFATKSANVNEMNLAPEGLDIRNIASGSLFTMELSGTKQDYAEFAGPTAFIGALATYRAEVVVPLVLSATNVILDWGAGRVIGTDEYLVIKGTIAFGHSTIQGVRETAAAREFGVSAVIALDSSDLTPGAYVVVADSRHSRRGYQDLDTGSGAAIKTMQCDAFDLTPTLVVGGASAITVYRIALAIGLDLGAATSSVNIARAQIHTYIVKKVR